MADENLLGMSVDSALAVSSSADREKKEAYRRNVVKEIITTEKEYVNDLEVVVTVRPTYAHAHTHALALAWYSCCTSIFMCGCRSR